MKSFEVAFMPPHVFKEQLKRVLNLHLTPQELGALMRVYDGMVAEINKYYIYNYSLLY